MFHVTLTAEQQARYHDDAAPPYWAGLIFTTTIFTIIFAFRIYAQWLIKNLKAWDNIFAILAFLCLIMLNGFTAWQFTKGAGHHLSRVLYDDPQALTNIRFIFIAWYWITILSAQACLWIKLAMLLFIRRVLPCDSLIFKISWWITCVLSIMIGVGSTIEFIFTCAPISHYWNRMIYYYGAAVGYPDAASFPAGKCIPMPTYLEIPIIASFITDVFLFLLPLIPLWNMQLPMVKKVSVFLTLSLGLFAIGIDVVRIREIVHFDRFDDATYRNIGGVAWNAIEYNVAMVSACIPAMAPLLRRDLWKRGARARSQKQAAIQLDDDNATFYKSERNLLGPSPIYFASDYQIWGDRSEQWRDQTRRPSEASTWSGATRSGSIATAAEKERQRQESLSSSVGGRRISDTATITELYQMPSSAADYPHPTKNAEWI